MQDIFEFYTSNGYFTPIDVLSSDEMHHIAKKYAEYEENVSVDGKMDGNYRFRSHLLVRWVWDLVHHPKIIDVVSKALGTTDILCWGTDFNIKSPESTGKKCLSVK